MKNLSFALCALLILLKVNAQAKNPNFNISIPIAGNSWVFNNPQANDQIITNEGIRNWKDRDSRIRTYFWFQKPGSIHLALKAHVGSGQSLIKVCFGSLSKEFKLKNTEPAILEIGDFQIDKAGYQYLELQGIKRSSETFAEISEILISSEDISDKVRFVKDEFYWGRRGPSVHLGYEIPAEAGDVRWFYNEMTIPSGNDVLGSYFMANGFGEGYFGIQVNSATERRILFSVWSPFKTDNPNSIPEDQKVRLLKKGKYVNSGEFGNEGAGGQSYRKYNWKAEVTYRFLLKAEPSEKNSTDYTAYFFAPEIGQWELIAMFRRPNTSTYLKNLHSFLENFIPDMGCITRQVYYTNQWICDTSGKWFELTKAKFTADATAHKDARLDYAGGSDNQNFFLKNCGFFSQKVSYNTWFTRTQTAKAPKIDFSKLP